MIEVGEVEEVGEEMRTALEHFLVIDISST